jgi:hypothetical protein
MKIYFSRCRPFTAPSVNVAAYGISPFFISRTKLALTTGMRRVRGMLQHATQLRTLLTDCTPYVYTAPHMNWLRLRRKNSERILDRNTVSEGPVMRPVSRCLSCNAHLLSLTSVLRKRAGKETNSVVWVRERTTPTELVLTFAVRGWHLVSVTDPCGRILGFLDFFFQVAPQLYSRGWVGPVLDPLLLRESGSAGNRHWVVLKTKLLSATPWVMECHLYVNSLIYIQSAFYDFS